MLLSFSSSFSLTLSLFRTFSQTYTPPLSLYLSFPVDLQCLSVKFSLSLPYPDGAGGSSATLAPRKSGPGNNTSSIHQSLSSLPAKGHTRTSGKSEETERNSRNSTYSDSNSSSSLKEQPVLGGARGKRACTLSISF